MKEKSIKINAILNGTTTMLSMIFPLITFPYASRVLQVDNFGKVNFSNSIISYFLLIAGLGITTYAIREGARLRDDKEKLSEFANQIFTINIVSTIIAYILLIGTMILVPKFHGYTVLLAIQSITIIGTTIGINWLYSIYEDYLYITVRSLLFQIVSLILLFVLVHNQDDYFKYASINVISIVGSNILNYFHSKKYLSISLTAHLNLKRHLKPILIIFASSIATTIYVNFDSTMIGFINGEYYVGLFSMGVKVYFITKSIVASLILVTLPRLSNYLATKRINEYKQTSITIFRTFMIFLLPILVGLFVTAKSIVIILGGKTYIDATISLRILSFSLFFSIIAIFYTNAVLLPMKREKVVLKATIISAIANLSLNFIFIPLWKQNGAAVTTLISEMIVCTILFLSVKNEIRFKIKFKELLGIIVGCFAIIGVSFIVNWLCSNFILNIVLTIVLSVLVYFSVLIIFKNEIVIATLSNYKNKIYI